MQHRQVQRDKGKVKSDYVLEENWGGLYWTKVHWRRVRVRGCSGFSLAAGGAECVFAGARSVLFFQAEIEIPIWKISSTVTMIVIFFSLVMWAAMSGTGIRNQLFDITSRVNLSVQITRYLHWSRWRPWIYAEALWKMTRMCHDSG